MHRRIRSQKRQIALATSEAVAAIESLVGDLERAKRDLLRGRGAGRPVQGHGSVVDVACARVEESRDFLAILEGLAEEAAPEPDKA